MVVAGTGVTSAVNAPGSAPQYYRLVHVEPANLVNALRADLRKPTVSSTALRIFTVVADNVVGAPFVTNPRCAEMVALVASKVAIDGRRGFTHALRARDGRCADQSEKRLQHLRRAADVHVAL